MRMNLSRLKDHEECTFYNALWNFILESTKKDNWEEKIIRFNETIK
jgi:hypothetical protein|tara:strand:- start:4207 stop:4344 length:138 start_codon:yes stop_codon:yes gene_type:complete